MKLLVSTMIITFTTVFSDCNNTYTNSNDLEADSNRVKYVDIQLGTTQIDSILLDFAKNKFIVNKEQLNECISKEFDSFIIQLGENQLHNQPQVSKFISIIILKMYYYHLKCCNRGLDISVGTKKSSQIIINEYAKLLKKDKLAINSASIQDYINSQSGLKNDKDILDLRNNISYLLEKERP